MCRRQRNWMKNFAILVNYNSKLLINLIEFYHSCTSKIGTSITYEIFGTLHKSSIPYKVILIYGVKLLNRKITKQARFQHSTITLEHILQLHWHKYSFQMTPFFENRSIISCFWQSWPFLEFLATKEWESVWFFTLFGKILSPYYQAKTHRKSITKAASEIYGL